MERDFSAGDAGDLWLTDIPPRAGGAPSEHWTDEGKLHLCAVKDVFSGFFVRSGRGSRSRSRKLVHALHRHHLIGSMGQAGAAGDDAAMESFFALVQKNVLGRKQWRTREELRIAIATWIERACRRCRRQARLGRLTPVEDETIKNPAVSLAA